MTDTTLVECAACGRGVEPEKAHWGHEPGCNGPPCECDLYYHEDCCPECTDEEPADIPTGDVMP